MTKHSEGIKKVSIHATNPDVSSFKTLVKDILHGREMLVEPGLSDFILPDGTIFEFYGPISLIIFFHIAMLLIAIRFLIFTRLWNN